MMVPLRALLIEDHESDAALIIRKLEGDFTVIFKRIETTVEMKEALAKDTWDIIISDYNLPSFNAPSALELLKDTGLDIPFIVISAAIGEETAVQLLLKGAKDFLRKDGLSRLVSVVKRELKDAQDRKEHRKDSSLLARQLIFTRALNKIAEVVITKDSAGEVLENTNSIIGETLKVDRVLLYHVSFKDRRITGLSEWINPARTELWPTKGEHPLELFISPATEIKRTGKYLESHANAMGEHFIPDGSGKYMHEHCYIKSLLWYPFAFEENEYHLFTLTNIFEQRKWLPEELGFLEAAVKYANLALIKLKLTGENIHSAAVMQESEEKFRLLFDSGSDAVMVHGLSKDGLPTNFTEVNNVACERLGYSKEELLKMSPLNTDAPDRSAQMPEIIEKLTKNKKVLFETEHIARDGRRIPVEISSVLLEREGKVLVLSFARDISRRKQAEKQELLTKTILSILNTSLDMREVVAEVLSEIQKSTKLEAVGIRLKEGEDFPYFSQRGLSDDFVASENSLVSRDKTGGLCRDANGKITLRCTCGLVLSGKTPRNNPLFTARGSFWINNSLPLLSLPAKEDPRKDPLNLCIHKGYQSFALVPILGSKEIIGLLQLNSKNTNYFSPEMLNYFEDIASIIGASILRKQAEKDLKDSEEKFSRAFMESPEAITLSNIKENAYVEVNKGFVLLSGYAKEEIIGKSTLELKLFKNSLDRDRMLKEIETTGRLENFIVEMRSKSGEFKLVRITVAIIDYRNEKHILSMIKDVTLEKKAELQLKELNSHLLRAERVGKIGYWKNDLATGNLEWSEEMYRIMGFSSRKPVNLEEAVSVFPPEELVRFRKALKDLIDEGVPYSMDYRIVLKDGTEKYIHDEGEIEWSKERKPLLMFGTTQDITRSKKQELHLYEIKEQLNLAVSGSGTGLWDWKIQTGEVSLNERWAEMLGYSLKELEPLSLNTWKKLTEPEDLKMSEEILEKHLLKESEVYECEIRMKHKDGQWVWILDRGKVNEWSTDGKPVRMTGTHMDITGSKKLEQDLLQTRKMDAIGNLAAGIAHDFNNMLGVIMGYSDVILKLEENGSKTKENVLEIKKAATRAAALTSQLLAFTRKQPLVRKVISMNEVLVDITKILERIIGENVEFETILDPKLKYIYADHGRLDQVIINLVTNSKYALPEGGKITVKTENTSFDKKKIYNIAGSRPGEYICMSIIDNGAGINPENMEHIFEPFYTTKPFGKGSGLGLSVVYGVVKEPGGWINVYSKPGEGTEFRVYVPVFNAKKDKAEKEETIQEKGNEKGKVILLVEDEISILDMLSTVLTEETYRVYTAKNGKEALEIFAKEKDRIELLFTDAVMPGISGFDLALKIKAIKPGIKIIISSGYLDNNTDMEQAAKKGFNFLQKPYELNELYLKISQVLAGKK